MKHHAFQQANAALTSFAHILAENLASSVLSFTPFISKILLTTTA
jgi:hypothetical protein